MATNDFLNNYKTSMRRTLDYIVAMVLGMASAAVFAQMLTQGELTKAIVLFYQKEYLDDQPLNLNYQANVTEMFIIEMEFLKISFHLIAGILIIALSFMLKRYMGPSNDERLMLEGQSRTNAKVPEMIALMEEVSRTKRETIIYAIASIGLILWDVGYLIIGYEKPSWGMFNAVSMGMIAFGGGLFVWGSFILFMHRIAEIKGTTSVSQRGVLALFASGPPIFILFFFTHLQKLAYEAEIDGDKFQFYLVYRSIGTFMLPIVVFVVCVGFLDVCAYGCSLPSEIVEMAEGMMEVSSENQEEETTEFNWNTMRWKISFTFFLLSKFFFGTVFFSAVLLYSNWIHHVDGPSSFTISNPDGTGFNTVSAGYELLVTRYAMLLMAVGVFIGRFMLVFVVDFPKILSKKDSIKSSPGTELDESKDGDEVYAHPELVGWSMVIRFMAHLFSLGGILGWHLRTYDTSSFSTGDIYGIAFVIGLGNGSIFLDGFISVLLYFKMDRSPMYMSGYDDVRLMVMLLIMVPLITFVMGRFSSGALGNLGSATDRHVDYSYYTMILTWFIGVASLCDLISFISHPTSAGTGCCVTDEQRSEGSSRVSLRQKNSREETVPRGFGEVESYGDSRGFQEVSKQSSRRRSRNKNGYGGGL